MRKMLAVWFASAVLVVPVFAAAQPVPEPAGSSNSDVVALQRRLADAKCYAGPIDGTPSKALNKAIAACPPQAPQLRIETGMHVAAIQRIGVDAACRIAATASEDKTVRVWSLPEGRLLRTLRVPIGDGEGGKVTLAAVSPDGRWVAAGGWDEYYQVNRHDFGLYVFDASSGAIMARIGGFAEAFHGLAVSPDGRWLAAASEAGVGVKLIDTSNWRVVAADKAYAGLTYGETFGTDGRLYTVSYDGKLRRYGPAPNMRKERQIATRGGKRPFSVALDPSGTLLAVGFDDTTRVDVYDAATLALRFEADTRGIDTGDLSKVAWRSDGALLIAGGRYFQVEKEAAKLPLVAFNRAGQRIGLLPVANSSITDVRPCGDGFAVATADANFGLVDRDGKVSLWRKGVAADMRGKLGGWFMVSADARRVQFGLGLRIADPVLFDLAEATLTDAPAPVAGLAPAPTEGLPIGLTEHGATFAGRTIPFWPFEELHALAVRPDRTGFVLGTEYLLRAYDGRGTRRWIKVVPGTAWGVNLSADGNIVVVADGDGTIRWHRWSDGQELLAMFVNRSTKAWVAWTPTGYYMASPGGENLIGWHVNRGWEQAADFFPASRFRDRFNRPDIVRLVLDTLDEDTAVKQANAAASRKTVTTPLFEQLPPIIHIANPTGGAHVATADVSIAYSWRSPSGRAVDRIEVLVDGRPAKEVALPLESQSKETETVGTLTVSLRGRESEIGLIAWSGDAASEAATIRLVWDNAPAAGNQDRRLYALVVGVGDYAARDLVLGFAAKDASDFAKALAGQKGAYYSDVQTRVITDRTVTRQSIIEGLEWLEKNVTRKDDVGVLFLAGHGVTDEKQTYWFLPSDATEDDFRFKGVSQDEMRRSLQTLPGKALWFLDTCHAGGAARRPVDVNVLVNTVTASENGGIVAFASSTGRELSEERADWNNGAFTKAIVEGIADGKADIARDGDITTSLLDFFIEKRVRELTGGKQHPVMGRPPEEPDFTIAQVADHLHK